MACLLHLTLVALSLTRAAAQALRGSRADNHQMSGVYVLQNVNSGKYLNVEGGATDNGASVWVWDNPGMAESQWEVQPVTATSYTFRNVLSDKYLNVDGDGEITFWDNVRIWDDAGSPRSMWEISFVNDDIYTLKIVNSHMYLNVLGGWLHNGANVHMWDNPYSNHSQWHMQRVQEGTTTTVDDDVRIGGTTTTFAADSP